MNTLINSSDCEKLDGKIDEVARALQYTRAFKRQLPDTSGPTGAYVHRFVVELEDRLAALRSMRTSSCAEDC